MTLQSADDAELKRLRERLSTLATRLALDLSGPVSDDAHLVVHCIEALERQVSRLQADAVHAGQRLSEISEVLGAAVGFDFSKRISFSDRDDVFDGFAVFFNTLVDDIFATTVSKAWIDNIIESVTDSLLVIDERGLMKLVSKFAARRCEYTREELMGQSIHTLFPKLDLTLVNRDNRVVRQDTLCRTKSGDVFPVSVSASLMINRKREVDGIVCVAQDLTEDWQAEDERLRMRQTLARQVLLLEELSTPILPISEGIVVIPLVGSIDQDRANRIPETVLHGAIGYQASVAIVDITGARAMNEAAIQGIVAAARCLRLVGVQVMLTGIQPDIAAIMPGFEADLSDIAIHASLQAAITDALGQHRMQRRPLRQRGRIHRLQTR